MGGFLQETGFVVGVGIDGIEGLNAGGTRGLQNGAAGEQQFGAFRRAFGAQVANIVFRAQRNPDQPFRGVGDFYRAGNTQRRFHGG
ncbi:Uncharacterised protein [Salmonella enterica subsp. enterica serovar Typhimurium str. DT104]|nr:Uncharacterised protein [Salmonella enterica subsp. enterica serovar Typhimurium str. DT104]